MVNLVRRRSPRGYYRCAFTGYRPQKMPFGLDESDPRCVDFKTRLRETIEGLIGQRYAHFISGGAMGMDTYAAEIVLGLKEKYPWVIWEMVSPFDAQAEKWTPEQRARHDRLFELADITTATGHSYDRGCMFRRNRYLIDNADLLLAAYDRQSDGTAMTCELTEHYHVPVMRINPPLRSSQNSVQKKPANTIAG